MQCYFIIKDTLKDKVKDRLRHLEKGLETPRCINFVPSWFETRTEDAISLAQGTPFVQLRHPFRCTLLHRCFSQPCSSVNTGMLKRHVKIFDRRHKRRENQCRNWPWAFGKILTSSIDVDPRSVLHDSPITLDFTCRHLLLSSDTYLKMRFRMT